MITTQRLILRPWRQSDRAAFALINRDPDVMRRLGMTPRPDLDFDHPGFATDHALCRHLVYAIDRRT